MGTHKRKFWSFFSCIFLVRVSLCTLGKIPGSRIVQVVYQSCRAVSHSRERIMQVKQQSIPKYAQTMLFFPWEISTFLATYLKEHLKSIQLIVINPSLSDEAAKYLTTNCVEFRNRIRQNKHFYGGEYWTKTLLDRTVWCIVSFLPSCFLIVPGMRFCLTRWCCIETGILLYCSQLSFIVTRILLHRNLQACIVAWMLLCRTR